METEAAIGNLRRRIPRTWIWIWSFVGSFVIGLLVAAPIAAYFDMFASRTPTTLILGRVFGTAAFLLPIIGFAGVYLMWGDVGKLRKSLVAAEQAKLMNYRFEEIGDKNLAKELKELKIFSNAGKLTIRDCIFGKCQGLDVCLLTLKIQTSQVVGNAMAYSWSNQTVTIVQGLPAEVPDLLVLRHDWLDRLMGARAIALPGQAEFCKAYGVSGENVAAIQKCFTKRAEDIVTRTQATVEVCDDWLVVFGHNQIHEPKAWPALVESAAGLAKSLQSLN